MRFPLFDYGYLGLQCIAIASAGWPGRQYTAEKWWSCREEVVVCLWNLSQVIKSCCCCGVTKLPGSMQSLFSRLRCHFGGVNNTTWMQDDNKLCCTDRAYHDMSTDTGCIRQGITTPAAEKLPKDHSTACRRVEDHYPPIYITRSIRPENLFERSWHSAVVNSRRCNFVSSFMVCRTLWRVF